MTKKLFALKDTLTSVYGKIIEAEDVKLLERELKYVVNQGQMQHVEDQQLYELGTFDTKTGKVLPLENPKFIINLSEYKEIKKG